MEKNRFNGFRKKVKAFFGKITGKPAAEGDGEPKQTDGKKTSFGKIVSFEIVTLHTSGMRHVTDYELLMKDGKAEVSVYGIRYSDGEKQRVLQKRAVCGEEEILRLLNRCKFLSWDGFYGPHPKGVLDGTMFRLEATVNGGRKIRADGSQNFPRHYRDFTDGLYEILERKETLE